MSESIDLAARPASKPRAEAGRFDQTSVALHWLTVVLVAAQLTMGTLLSHGGDEMPALLTAHRSIGIAILIVVTARLAWRHGFARRYSMLWFCATAFCNGCYPGLLAKSVWTTVE